MENQLTDLGKIAAEMGFYTLTEFHRLYNISDGFDDDFNTNHRDRPSDESYFDYLRKGSAALVRAYPDFASDLMSDTVPE